MSIGWCNPYGAENKGGHPVVFGGFLPNPASKVWECHNRPEHRWRWTCEHGHAGPIVALCNQHAAEFNGDRSVPMNVRRDVRSCPRCASEAARPEEQHKCKVRLVAIS